MPLCPSARIVHISGAALLIAGFLLPACSIKQAPPESATAAPEAPLRAAPEFPYRETGTAAWFGRELHGSRSAGGEIIDMHALSAAHRTLPLGTAIRVTNLATMKSITVKVLDRGPFIKKRVLDLSQGAAQELDFISQGTVQVLIEAGEAAREPGTFTVQAAIFTEEENARLLKERLNRKYELVTITQQQNNIGRFFRVRVGAYGSMDKAEQVAAKLSLDGLEPVVLRKD